MSPYIITTKRLVAGVVLVDRRAVATLDEAQWAVAEAIAAVNVKLEGMGDPKAFTPAERAQADEAISTAGGVIGLPDGTAIEVARVEWSALIDALPDLIYPYNSDQTIIDAYNAAQVEA